MLHTVNVALSPWTIACLTVSESGIQGLTIRSCQFGNEGMAIDLDRVASNRLADLLAHAEMARVKGLILDVENVSVANTADEIIHKGRNFYQLPF